MAELLKDRFLQQDFFNRLTTAIKQNYAAFDVKAFMASVHDEEWEKEELKQRMNHVAVALGKHLPQDYKQAVNILSETVKPFNGFEGILFADYTALYGLHDFKTSMQAIELFTQHGSAEFAIRPFIVKYTKETMEQMLKWAKHKNVHVRRLASEGCRPRLPWAMALPEFKKDPSLILPILEELKNDPEDYVYRSVANNLNDISKDHPELVLAIAKKWKGKHKNTDWVVKHALRGLLKQGDKRAMALFGYSEPKVKIANLKLNHTTIKIGDDTSFSFNLISEEKKPTKLRIEYGIDYMKSNGKQNRKVFKITENTYSPHTENEFTRKLSFKELTTRKHYTGDHILSIIVNGYELANLTFVLN